MTNKEYDNPFELLQEIQREAVRAFMPTILNLLKKYEEGKEMSYGQIEFLTEMLKKITATL